MDRNAQPAPCPRCQQPLRPATVRTDIWRGEHLYVIEDVPASMCDGCMEQFYDDDVVDALRRLNEDGFKSIQPKREMVVPVFSLEGLVRRPQASGNPE